MSSVTPHSYETGGDRIKRVGRIPADPAVHRPPIGRCEGPRRRGMGRAMEELATLLALQDGVIARRQVLEAGLPPAYVARKVRRREWVKVHPGVYVDHTGPIRSRPAGHD